MTYAESCRRVRGSYEGYLNSPLSSSLNVMMLHHFSRCRRSLTVTAGGYKMIYHPYLQSAYIMYELEWYRVSSYVSKC